MSGRHYDKAGKPITFEECARLFSDAAYQVVAHDVLEDLEVSTVWLPFDHNFKAKGPPRIFETMIFKPSDESITGRREVGCWRYATEAEALAGHTRVVMFIKNGWRPG